MSPCALARVRRIALFVAVWTALLLVVGVGQAYAGPAVFSNAFPQPLSVTSTDTFNVSVDYDDVAPARRAWAKVDGIWISPTIAVNPSDPTRGTITFPAVGLSDATHVAEVFLYNTSWKMSTYRWSFTVNTAVAPTLSDPVPAPGASISTSVPVVSAAVGGPLLTYQILLDGSPIPSSLVGGVVSGQPGVGLENDTEHTAVVDVVGTNGLANSLSWDFYVQVYPKMPDTIGTACTTCHVGYPASGHPMADCDACHGTGSPVGQILEPAAYAPGQPEHPSSWISGLSCTGCHTSRYPAIPAVHSAPPADPYHDTTEAACDECHQKSLTVEHYYRGNGLTCATCHLSTDPDVVAAIAAGDTACSSCHAFGSGGHPYITSAHVSDIDLASLSGSYPSGTYGPYECTACHRQELGPEHQRPTSSSAPADCNACHPTPRDTLSPWAKGCVQGGCHVVAGPQEQHGLMTASHDVSGEPLDAKCSGSGCHVVTDLGELHLGAGCTACHSDTSVPDTRVCEQCHPDKVDGTGNVIEHGYRPEDHTATPADASYVINGQTYGPYGCADCHTLELRPEHEKATSSSASTSPICAACHPTPVDSLVPSWDSTTCVQGGCHAAGTGVEQHGQIDSAHDRLPANDTCSGSMCHNSDLAGIHDGSASACLACHDAGVPAEKDCTVCHPDKVDGSGNVIDHAYSATTHAATVGANTISGTIPGAKWTIESGMTTVLNSTQTYSGLACLQCHSMDLYTEHTKPSSVSAPLGCDACHAGATPPAESFPAWLGSCSQGACHTTTRHAEMSTKHVVSNLDNSCSYCHSWGGSGTDIAASHNDYWRYHQLGIQDWPEVYPNPLPQNGCGVQFCHNQNVSVPTGKDCDGCHGGTISNWPHPDA